MTQTARNLDSDGKKPEPVFSTVVDGRERPSAGFESEQHLWSQAITKTFCQMDAQLEPAANVFSGRLYTRQTGRLQVSTVAAEPHKAVRTPAMIESEEDFFLSLVTNGYGEIRQGHQVATLSHGAFTIVDGARPFLFEFPVPFQQIIVRIPREDLLARLPEEGLEGALGLMLSGRSGPSSMLSAMLKQASHLAEADDQTIETALSLSALDMLGVILQQAVGDTSDTALTHQRDLRRVQNSMLVHLHDPEWTLADISHELGMSARYLHQLFTKQGLTPASWWMQARLERAQRILETSRVTVREVSERTGFKDPAHFSRAFRKWRGTTPGKIQALRGSQK